MEKPNPMTNSGTQEVGIEKTLDTCRRKADRKRTSLCLSFATIHLSRLARQNQFDETKMQSGSQEVSQVCDDLKKAEAPPLTLWPSSGPYSQA